MYKIARFFLFMLPPELSAKLTLVLLSIAAKLGYKQRVPSCPTKMLGLELDNPVGIAAGMDKNGDYIDALGSLGVGFIEIGSVSLTPMKGNPKPRMYRLGDGIINRLGLPNKGIKYVIGQLKNPRKYQGVIGLNVVKDEITPPDMAWADYVALYEHAHPYVDYVTVNLSCPNTTDNKELVFGGHVRKICEKLDEVRTKLSEKTGKYVPIVIKVSPALIRCEDVDAYCYAVDQNYIDGIIVNNTDSEHKHEFKGGLSGSQISMISVMRLHAFRMGTACAELIASGGVMTVKDAEARFVNEAAAIQLYTGLVFNGPQLIKDIVEWRVSQE